MTPQTLRQSLDFLFKKNTGVEHITLYGGEPLLHKSLLMQFFDYLQDLPSETIPRIDLITNATIIDPDVMYALKKWDALVIISLDGKEKHHNKYRVTVHGNGTYQQVIDGITAYQQHGLRVGISLVLGQHNYKDILSICVDLKQKYQIVSIGLTIPHMEPDIVINKDSEEYLLNHYDEILDVCQEQELWFEQGMKRLLCLADKEKYIYGCPTSPKGCMVRILPDGVVTLCENLGLRGLYQLCNVKDPDVSVETAINSEMYHQWYSRCTNVFDQCKSCIAYSICGLGCPYDAYLETGSICSIEYRSCAITRQAVNWYLNRALTTVTLSENEKVKVLSLEERKRILVECPWKKK